MKTIDQIHADRRRHAAVHREKQARLGLVRLCTYVPAATRQAVAGLAARARAGEPLHTPGTVTVPDAVPEPTSPAATVPDACGNAETQRLAERGRDLELLATRHAEIYTILRQAIATPRGEFVAMLHTLFPAPVVTLPDTPQVADLNTSPVTIPDTQPVAPPVTGDVSIQPTPARAPLSFRAGLGVPV